MLRKRRAWYGAYMLSFMVSAASFVSLHASTARAQTPSGESIEEVADRFRFTMRVGVARGISGIDRLQTVGNATGVTSQYRLRTSAAWGGAVTYQHRPQWGLRLDLDAIGPVQFNEVSRNALVQGQSVAWLGGLSLTYTPVALCKVTCLTISAGPGAGFYELAEHKEVAARSFAVSKTQLAYATRAGIELRGPGRFRQLSFGVSDYFIKFSPDVAAADLTALHHVVLNLSWTPP